MNRVLNIKSLENQNNEWEVVIIGGGASGLGVALDSANRGYRTLLLEKDDFAMGTSSNSTKLVHGGLRYLKNLQFSVVMQSLKERRILIKNAPHIVKKISFILPFYSHLKKFIFLFGLKLYDFLSFDYSFGISQYLNKIESIKKAPDVKLNKLKGSVLYYDGQFDDSRMAICVAKSAQNNGAILINYCEVTKFFKKDNKIISLEAYDKFSQKSFVIKSKAFINASGIFSTKLMKLDNANYLNKIKLSQGTHLVFEQSIFQGKTSLIFPNINNSSVLFCVHWYNFIIVGTTDNFVNECTNKPTPKTQEIEYILDNLNYYLNKKISKNDIKSVFSGLRPLLDLKNKSNNSKTLSRSHNIIVNKSGLISILGGKWTTYRLMAEKTINKVIEESNLKYKKCNTSRLKLHGYKKNINYNDPLYMYGSDIENINKIDYKNSKKSISKVFHITKNQIIWAVREEMAVTLDDVLSRRIRCLCLDSKEAVKISLKVAKIMAQELKQDDIWINNEVKKFKIISNRYVVNNLL